jgi:hypothetical protein
MIGDRTEHQEQAAVVQWAALMASRYPALGMLFAVPNGANKSPVARGMFRAEGLKRGVPDLILPVARVVNGVGYHGMAIEMKRRRGGVASPEQREWIAAFVSEGWMSAVCRGSDEAQDMLLTYMRGSAWKWGGG